MKKYRGEKREEEEFHLYVEEKGEGMPLVLLHGNGESSAYFSHQIDFFSKEYRVVAVDTRGHGKSPRGTGPFTLGQFAEDLKALLDEMGLRKVILLGFSDGANIAMMFTLKYQEYVERLILNGGNRCPFGVRWSVQVPVVLGYGLLKVVSLFDKKAARKRELLALMVREPHISPEDLRRIQVPTLVMAGTKDMIKESHTKEIQKEIPGSVLCILEGSHFIADERPESFNLAVEAFLRGEKSFEKGEENEAWKR